MIPSLPYAVDDWLAGFADRNLIGPEDARPGRHRLPGGSARLSVRGLAASGVASDLRRAGRDARAGFRREGLDEGRLPRGGRGGRRVPQAVSGSERARWCWRSNRGLRPSATPAAPWTASMTTAPRTRSWHSRSTSG